MGHLAAQPRYSKVLLSVSTTATRRRVPAARAGSSHCQNARARFSPVVVTSVKAGTALDRATAAALEQTGGGTVTETEVGDDGAAYGVEVRLDDGSQVEVNLDENFNVIGQAADDDGPNDQDGPDDD